MTEKGTKIAPIELVRRNGEEILIPKHFNEDNSPTSLADSDDRVLIQMAIAGRADCFSMLVDQHLAAVKRYLQRIVSNEEDLDDLIQDALLKAWMHLDTFRTGSKLSTLMIRIGINRARELHRRRQCRLPCQTREDLAQIASPSESPEESLLRAEAADAAHSAVAKLPSKYRILIVHQDVNELCGKEIAQRLNITLSAVKTRLSRASLILATKLQKSKRSRMRRRKLDDAESSLLGTAK